MAGALFGGFIHNPETFGLDFALVAMFLGLFLFRVERPFKQKNNPNKYFAFKYILLINHLDALFLS